jgi:hypothetical protein
MTVPGGKTGAESDGRGWQNIPGDLRLIKRAHLIAGIAHKPGLAMMLAPYAWGVVWRCFLCGFTAAAATPLGKITSARASFG